MTNISIKNLSLDVFIYIVGIPCLFMMIITSRGFTQIKIVLLLLFSFICFIDVVLNRSSIMICHIRYVLVFMTYFMLSLIFGIVNGYEFHLENDYVLFQYYVFTPIIVLIIASCISWKSKRREVFISVFKYISLFMAIMDVWKLFCLRGVLPDVDPLNLFMVSSAVTDVELSLRISNEHGFMFILPYFTVLMFLEKKNIKDSLINKLIFGFGVIYSLLSGRKILQIVFALSVIFMIFYVTVICGKTKKILKYIALGALIILVAYRVGNVLNIGNIFQRVQHTLSRGLSKGTLGVDNRLEYMAALVELWLKSPIIGNGLNSHAADTIANSQTKWSYEVFYHAFLAQSGIVGIIIYAIGVLYLCRKLRKQYEYYKDATCMAALLGFVCFVLCGSTNPLIVTPWVWIFVASIAFTHEHGNLSSSDDYCTIEQI